MNIAVKNFNIFIPFFIKYGVINKIITCELIYSQKSFNYKHLVIISSNFFV